MKAIKKLYLGFVNIEGWLAIVAFTAAIVLNAYEIFQRNVLGNSFIWIQEISVLLMLWFAMLGLPKVVNDNEDICLDLFIKKFPPQLRKLVDFFVALMLAVMDMVLLIYLHKLYLSQGHNVTIIAQYPLRWRSIALFLGIGSVEVRYIVNVIVAGAALFGINLGKGEEEK